jgi:hypothetical protein
MAGGLACRAMMACSRHGRAHLRIGWVRVSRSRRRVPRDVPAGNHLPVILALTPQQGPEQTRVHRFSSCVPLASITRGGLLPERVGRGRSTRAWCRPRRWVCMVGGETKSRVAMSLLASLSLTGRTTSRSVGRVMPSRSWVVCVRRRTVVRGRSLRWWTGWRPRSMRRSKSLSSIASRNGAPEAS